MATQAPLGEFQTLKPVGVSQTSFMFGAVFVAFLIYITLRGDLSKWIGVFTGTPNPTAPPTSAATQTTTGAVGASPLTQQNTGSIFNFNPANTSYAAPGTYQSYIDAGTF